MRYRWVWYKNAPLAQRMRASGYEPEGREFESLRAYTKLFPKRPQPGVFSFCNIISVRRTLFTQLQNFPNHGSGLISQN
jgi:hypothetical protein